MDFNSSSKLGMLGEELFEKYLSSTGKLYKDVRNDERFQELDIDYVIFKPEYYTEDDRCLDVYLCSALESGNPDVYKKRREKIGCSVEVKVDCVTHNRKAYPEGTISHGTGNMVYEVISHNNVGCMARTRTDYLFYVCVDNFDNKDVYEVVKVYYGDMFDIRAYICNPDNKDAVKVKALKFVDGKEENIFNLLLPVNDMVLKGALSDCTSTYKDLI